VPFGFTLGSESKRAFEAMLIADQESAARI